MNKKIKFLWLLYCGKAMVIKSIPDLIVTANYFWTWDDLDIVVNSL